MHYHGHRKRLRERLADAPETLADYEILELLLGYALLRRDTKPLAKDLLQRFTSLRGIFEARPGEYAAIPGIGEGIAGFLALLREFLSRYAESPTRARAILCSPRAVAAMARERLGKLAHEEIWLALVDRRNRLIAWERIAQGTVNASTAFLREIIEHILAVKAAGVVLAHNHPGGDPTPSDADREFTLHISRALRPLGIRLVDHVVVTENRCYSLHDDDFLES
ncbi:MAG: DNA repair protein RadC [Desulfovibrio sp.]|jgi:DNA repair protein RadC|nr:DNA repair protein RadC [Desulfovibrio sp.]